jgi:hypothetical protein
LSAVTGLDDHSRFCVCARLVTRATARPVCDALAATMRAHGLQAGPTGDRSASPRECADRVIAIEPPMALLRWWSGSVEGLEVAVECPVREAQAEVSAGDLGGAEVDSVPDPGVDDVRSLGS